MRGILIGPWSLIAFVLNAWQLAAAQAEGHFPTLAGLARQLTEALSNIGI